MIHTHDLRSLRGEICTACHGSYWSVMDLLALHLEEGVGLEPDSKNYHKTLSHLFVLFNRSIFAGVGSNKGNVSSLEPRIYTLMRTSQAGSFCIYKAYVRQHDVNLHAKS